MRRCEVCGNHYDKAFEVIADDGSHVFDCFACAIQALAPRCARCGTIIISLGMESAGDFYCCAHCARGASSTSSSTSSSSASIRRIGFPSTGLTGACRMPSMGNTVASMTWSSNSKCTPG